MRVENVLLKSSNTADLSLEGFDSKVGFGLRPDNKDLNLSLYCYGSGSRGDLGMF